MTRVARAPPSASSLVHFRVPTYSSVSVIGINSAGRRRSCPFFRSSVYAVRAHARAVREGHAKAQVDAVDHMTKKYAQELADKG
ncbi:hypothetical protein GQ649_02350 [Rhodococcus sp. DSM 6344]|nr:hypothetical protein [Rhodococcus erythropolis]